MAQTHMANDDSPVKKNFRRIAPLGIMASVAAASHCFFTRTESLRASIAGSGEVAGWHDRLAAAGHALGGWPGADTARALATATPVLIAFFSLYWLTQRLPARFKKQAQLGLCIAALSVTFFGFYKTFRDAQRDIRDVRLLAPVDLLKTVEATEGRVFMNASALSASRLLAPTVVPRAPASEMIPPLTNSPVRWREEEHQSPFTAILLAVPLASSRPLVEMISSSPEWQLAQVDNQGLLYLRRSSTKKNAITVPVFSSIGDIALYDAQSAMVLHFLGKNKEARDLMSKARQSAPENAFVRTQSAILAASLRQWATTREEAESALKMDSTSTQARYLLALALLETGNISGAAKESALLSAIASDDPSALWLHARISREMNDPTNEITSLEKLLELAIKQNEEPTLIHIHLAQAWAKRGFATQALENYHAALQGNLSPKLRLELENAKSTIQSRSPQP